jgi:hypothetical protein
VRDGFDGRRDVWARIPTTSFPARVRLLGGDLVINARRDSMTMRGLA